MTAKRKKKGRVSGYAKSLQRFIDNYVAETGEEVIDMRAVAAWAINKRLWEPPKKTGIDLLAQDLSRAAREVYIEDEGGNPVRKRHAYRIKQGDKQLTFWVDIETAKPGQMKLSVLQRRLGIVGDCIQLQTDVDYYNGHNVHYATIPLGLDFTKDVADKKMPTDYPDAPPDGEEFELPEGEE